MPEVGCVALTLAKPEFRVQVEAALRALIEPVHREDGMLQYEMHVDRENPCQFVFIERWETLEHFQAHCRAPHVLDYLEKTKGMVEAARFYPLRHVAG